MTDVATEMRQVDVCQVKQACHRNISTMLFYLNEVPRIIEFIETESYTVLTGESTEKKKGKLVFNE